MVMVCVLDWWPVQGVFPVVPVRAGDGWFLLWYIDLYRPEPTWAVTDF